MSDRVTIVEVASTSTPRKSYRVWVGADGPEFCDCPGHKFVRKNGQRTVCKHMKALGASTALPTAVALAKGTTPTPAAHWDARFRFIEVQERTNESSEWMTTVDLTRFNQLEVN
jgi:hypothetical protein